MIQGRLIQLFLLIFSLSSLPANAYWGENLVESIQSKLFGPKGNFIETRNLDEILEFIPFKDSEEYQDFLFRKNEREKIIQEFSYRLGLRVFIMPANSISREELALMKTVLTQIAEWGGQSDLKRLRLDQLFLDSSTKTKYRESILGQGSLALSLNAPIEEIIQSLASLPERDLEHELQASRVDSQIKQLEEKLSQSSKKDVGCLGQVDRNECLDHLRQFEKYLSEQDLDLSDKKFRAIRVTNTFSTQFEESLVLINTESPHTEINSFFRGQEQRSIEDEEFKQSEKDLFDLKANQLGEVIGVKVSCLGLGRETKDFYTRCLAGLESFTIFFNGVNISDKAVQEVRIDVKPYIASAFPNLVRFNKRDFILSIQPR